MMFKLIRKILKYYIILLIFFIMSCGSMLSKKWRINNLDMIFTATVLEKSQKIILTTWNDLICLSYETGEILWSNNRFKGYYKPYLLNENEIVCKSDGTICVFDIESGSIKKEFNITGFVVSIIVKGYHVYFISKDGQYSGLEVLDTNTSEIKQLCELEIGDPDGFMQIQNDIIFISHRKSYQFQFKTISAIDCITGKLLWERDIFIDQGEKSQTLVFEGDSLYCIDKRKNKYFLNKLNKYTGEKISEFLLEGKVISHLQYSSGKIGIRGRGGNYLLFDTKTNKFLLIDNNCRFSYLANNVVTIVNSNRILEYDIFTGELKKSYITPFDINTCSKIFYQAGKNKLIAVVDTKKTGEPYFKYKMVLLVDPDPTPPFDHP